MSHQPFPQGDLDSPTGRRSTQTVIDPADRLLWRSLRASAQVGPPVDEDHEGTFLAFEEPWKAVQHRDRAPWSTEKDLDPDRPHAIEGASGTVPGRDLTPRPNRAIVYEEAGTAAGQEAELTPHRSALAWRRWGRELRRGGSGSLRR